MSSREGKSIIIRIKHYMRQLMQRTYKVAGAYKEINEEVFFMVSGQRC